MPAPFEYIEDLRQRLGLEPDDASRDDYIAKLSPMERLKMLCGWHIGDPNWATTFLDWARDAGMTIKDGEH